MLTHFILPHSPQSGKAISKTWEAIGFDAHGTVIEEYLDDKPYPNRFMLGWIGRRPIHVVVTYNQEENVRIVITAYEPDPQRWSDDFQQRRPK